MGEGLGDISTTDVVGEEVTVLDASIRSAVEVGISEVGEGSSAAEMETLSYCK